MTDNNKDLMINEEELESVTGGAQKIQMMTVACQFCGEAIRVNIRKSYAYCRFCKKKNTFAG